MVSLKSLALLALAGYAALIALMYLFQRSMMYFPDTTRTPPSVAGLPRAQEIALTTADGEALVAWHIPPGPARPVVIYFHGNGGALNLRAARFDRLTKDGVGLVAVSYRGYGGSTGRPSEPGLIRDAEAGHAFVAAHYPDRPIVLFGESLGTGVAVALAAERKIAGLILDSPFTSTVDVGAAAYPFAPVRWLMKDSFRSDLRIRQVQAPLLVLHGERDAVVPIRFGEALFALANEPKRMLRFPEGNHSDLDSHGATAAVAAFLADVEAEAR